MLRHLLEMMPASNVSGPGRDSAINLLVKQVPRKSFKNPDNSLTLWVIDQGMRPHLHEVGHPKNIYTCYTGKCFFCIPFHTKEVFALLQG